jgi:hypothetical protein
MLIWIYTRVLKTNADPDLRLHFYAVFRIRIRIRVDPYLNSSPGSGSVLRIRIQNRIQDSENGVQKGGKVCDFKLTRAMTILLRA